ncbi:MAG: hypothetical protein JWO66_992 [Candidatus Eremiobacteraeota bacterium]|jgi:hypothetical protein|nr:hypothetical protein [Candidatus Eremiobacteraeota bacterium]
MIPNLTGVAIVLLITGVAGVIAYIGDRVGHQVGRKRLTLFGLRPKYTSTIVAVATGMLIALSVTLVALVGSQQVRTAFFRLGQINARINDLQAQAIATQKQLDTTRGTSIALPIGLPIANATTIRPSQPDRTLLPELAVFFDQTVKQANRGARTIAPDLKPYVGKSSDPAVQAGLRAELGKIRDQIATLPADTPVLLLPVVGQNLFRGDTISFAFAHYVDNRVAAGGETLASLDVQGGQTLNLQALQVLSRQATAEVSKRGMPAYYAANVALNGPQAQDVLSQVARLRGKYRILAKASLDLYPHSGGVLLDFTLVPR